MSDTRLYVIKPKEGATNLQARIIEAQNASQALRRATRSLMDVAPASPKEVADLVSKGVKVESAEHEGPEATA